METINDIIREMREYADKQERMSLYDLRDLATETLRVFADRIEAAVKRSKYERLHECFWDKRAVQCVIRQMLDERDDLSSIDSISANRMDYFANLLIGAASDDGKSLGNVAKIREALEDSQSLLESFSWGEYGPQVREQMRDNRSTLAAPPRNCDKCKNADEAVALAIDAGVVDCGFGAREMAEFLLAEAKGENK